MHTHHDFAAIAALDLGPIKKKLMHHLSGEGWTREKADSVELEYRRFLYLAKKFPGEQNAPLVDVDIFWHYHILDTMKYMADCEAVFGHYLHHYPYAGMEGAEDDEEVHASAGARMKELYEQEFGAGSFAQSMQNMAGGQPANGAAWCVIPPAVRPEQASAAVAAAWCVIPPASRMASGPAAAAPVMGAWCVIPPASRMSVQARPAAGAGTKTAWCVIPPAAPARSAPASAWCVIPPAAPKEAPQPAAA